MAIQVKRKPVKLYPDPKRVVARFFMPGQPDRARSIVHRVEKLSGKEAKKTFEQVLKGFSNRHRDLQRVLENNFEHVKGEIGEKEVNWDSLSHEKKLLISSYFTMEYAIESAAFFNPSIVVAPVQTGAQDGGTRVIVSFRATGEGHISSIVFRKGVIDGRNDLYFDRASNFLEMPEVVMRHLYEKRAFLKKLEEMHIYKDVIGMVMDPLGDEFTYGELQESIYETMKMDLSYSRKQVIHAINWLADSHYEVSFSEDTALSERVLFPVSWAESNGIEDARFVRFLEDDGKVQYYATYTAYNGYTILPKLLQTEDFYHFRIMPLHGGGMQNKGVSLFPRKVRGRYAMVSRCDGVNNYIMFSDNINVWNNAKVIEEPRFPWEFVQIGNCGSPIETKEGWILITHGVGPMREYCLGAALLDLENPSKLIARLKEPLIAPNEEERDGYVPNIVYSCGSIAINGEILIPYGMADYGASFAAIGIGDLLSEMTQR
ncbi:MAG: glycoside hydrolase family 130 protein [Spirochaetes bacterium]|nr:glycoside hydrolase family 130 protein [Spirochaetota bacterium]